MHDVAQMPARVYNEVETFGLRGSGLAVADDGLGQLSLFPGAVPPRSTGQSEGHASGREVQLWRAYRFLVETASEGFTETELARAAGWERSTVKTYLSKKWRGFVTRRHGRLFFVGIEQMSWEQFRELHSQVDPSTRNADWYGLSQERMDLDFMGPINWDNADLKTKFGILKTVLGLSNIPSGGRIVIGVRERNGLFDFVGLTEEEAASFEQTKVAGFLSANAEGRIRVSVSRVNVYGKRFVVLNVLPYDDIPVLSKQGEHRLRKGGLYLRTAAAETKLVESSDELRLILQNFLRRHQRTDTATS